MSLLRHTEVGIDEANELLNQAGLSSVKSMELLPGGWDNTNILLALFDDSKIVLKVWNANTIEEVRRVIERHCHLDNHGIPTAVPIEITDGDLIAEREGVAWTLLPFFEGGMLDSEQTSLRSLGETIARLHKIPIADCFPEDYRMGWSLFERMYAMADENGEWNNFVAGLKEESEKLLVQIPENLPQGILHGDLFPDNVIGDGSVAAILDLEEAFIGPCAFDLVMAFVGFGWDDGVPIRERWNALLEGYESIRQLSQQEKDSLPALHRYATISIAAWRYWKHVMSEPDETLTERYMEMFGRLEQEVIF
ncbi:MAG: phosphotransferase [Candidatus Thermoplasmatota archaeon]|nr:phosphotransferase [Candidatus Thermoplasmatota archaeon]